MLTDNRIRVQRGFETTSWSLILAASASDEGRSAAALADLCARYRPPVLAYIRRFGERDAEDLTQSFFARLLEKGYVAQADRARGRFRTFLLTAVKHFLANEHDRATTQKRGGASEHVAIDEDVRGSISPEEEFDRRWALRVIDQVVDAVRIEAGGEGIDHLLPFVTGDAARGGYGELAAASGMSEGALRVAVHRLRARFRHHLRSMIAATVTDAAHIDAEIAFLITAVSGRGGDAKLR